MTVKGLSNRFMKYPPLKSPITFSKKKTLEDCFVSTRSYSSGGKWVKGHASKTKWKQLSLALSRDSP